ncbi:MAG: hypothetical protein R2725_11555 [Solirubrobacterales bacterium]
MDAAGAASKRATGVRIAAREMRGARQFWTPARMRRAMPVELKVGRGRAPADTRRRAGATGSGFDVVPDPTDPVARVNGVVFFQELFGYGRCSGTAVESPNLSLVFTAGHCVHESLSLLGGTLVFHLWHTTNWVFVPAYRYGQRPFGAFPAKWLGATREWLLSGSPNADVGVAVVGRNERGERLQRAVGGAGITWNRSPNQVFDVHGYPVEKPYGGKVQRLCADRPNTGHDVYSLIKPGPLNVSAECRVSGGASGGGWTIGDGVLNSVTSYSYGGNRGTAFGPYFGKEVARLYRRAGEIR